MAFVGTAKSARRRALKLQESETAKLPDLPAGNSCADCRFRATGQP
jgi:hypothetical protein